MLFSLEISRGSQGWYWGGGGVSKCQGGLEVSGGSSSVGRCADGEDLEIAGSVGGGRPEVSGVRSKL